jgi:hypothetical protein
LQFLSNQGDNCMSLIIKSKIEDMEIGDIITCRYKAAFNTAGAFSELGTCTIADIPLSGTATPDGKFNFVKSDKGLLIADRVVQTGVSWDTLNTSFYIQGRNRAKISLFSRSSIYSDSQGTMGTAGAPTDDKGGAWYASCWSPSGSDGAPNIVVAMGKPDSLKSIYIECKDWGVNTYPSNNTLTISTSISAVGPYSPVLVSPIVKGVNNYIIPDNPICQYIKLSVPRISSYGYASAIISTVIVNTIDTNIIRSLSGGNAYLGTNGNASLTDQGLGACPVTNEWDKYILNSDLDGKIKPGDNNVWHWNNGAGSWCQDTSVLNLQNDSSHLATNVSRTRRGITGAALIALAGMGYNASSTVLTSIGFRPVLQYPEDPECENAWY